MKIDETRGEPRKTLLTAQKWVGRNTDSYPPSLSSRYIAKTASKAKEIPSAVASLQGRWKSESDQHGRQGSKMIQNEEPYFSETFCSLLLDFRCWLTRARAVFDDAPKREAAEKAALIWVDKLVKDEDVPEDFVASKVLVRLFERSTALRDELAEAIRPNAEREERIMLLMLCICVKHINDIQEIASKQWNLSKKGTQLHPTFACDTKSRQGSVYAKWKKSVHSKGFGNGSIYIHCVKWNWNNLEGSPSCVAVLLATFSWRSVFHHSMWFSRTKDVCDKVLVVKSWIRNHLDLSKASCSVLASACWRHKWTGVDPLPPRFFLLFLDLLVRLVFFDQSILKPKPNSPSSRTGLFCFPSTRFLIENFCANICCTIDHMISSHSIMVCYRSSVSARTNMDPQPSRISFLPVFSIRSPTFSTLSYYVGLGIFAVVYPYRVDSGSVKPKPSCASS